MGFPMIIQRSQDGSFAKPMANSSVQDMWDSNTETFLLPYGDDVWNENALRTLGNGKFPSWSKFVFFKASREIILPEIEAEVQYNNPKHLIPADFESVSLPDFEEPEQDICELAKTNFREASKLFVIVIGYQHSGTTMIA